MSSISIIIPLWNGRNLLPGCLESLRTERLKDGSSPEIIVVDNASVDSSTAWIAAQSSAVKLIQHRNNLGFGGGCNRGMRSAQGEILVLLNQDTQVYPGWLQAIEGAFSNPKIGIAGCKIYYPDGKTIQHAGGKIDWPGGNGSHFGYKEEDNGQWDEPRSLEWVTGAAMAIRRTVFETIGELDEDFWPGYFEDVDYCLRARKHGFEVWYIPSAALQHQESTSIRNPRDLQRIHERNRLLCWLKHTPPAQWLAALAPEEEKMMSERSGEENWLRQNVYTEVAALTPHLLIKSWQAAPEMIDAVVATLQQLARIGNTQIKALEAQSALQDFEPLTPPVLKLTEFGFHSNTPVIGAVLSSFRKFIYGISTRWVVHHLHKELGAYSEAQQRFGENVEAQMQTQLQQTLQMHSNSFQQIELLQKRINNLDYQLEILTKRNALLTQQMLQVEHQLEEPQS